MSWRNIKRYDEAIIKYYGEKEKKDKYIDLLQAEIIKIGPKLIADKIRGFKMIIENIPKVDEEAIERILFDFFRRLFNEGFYLICSEKIDIVLYPKIYDVELSIGKVKIERYLLRYSGAVDIEINFDSDEIPIEWQVEAKGRDDKVTRVKVYTV